MPFVKLDCGILRSTLWFNRDAREVFLTALLMAFPREFSEPQQSICIRTLDNADFIVPPGWYGFVEAAGMGILRIAGVSEEAGKDALETLAAPEKDSRSSEFEGRRMVRVNGGFVILNYMKYRDRDYTSAERQRRLREKRRHTVTSRSHPVTSRSHPVTSRHVTQAEAYTDTEKNTGRGEGGNGGKPEPKRRFAPPPLTEVSEFWKARGLRGEPEAFFDHFENCGWKLSSGRGPTMRDWHLAAMNWSRNEKKFGGQSGKPHGRIEPPAGKYENVGTRVKA